MTPSDTNETHRDRVAGNARLRRAQRLLDSLFRSLPLGRRIAAGLLMALKAVTAAMLAYAIGHALHTEQAFWAAITAISVTQPHFGETRGAGRDQCLGAAFGSVAGLLGLWIGGPADMLSYAVALSAVTVACWTANAGPAARLGGVTATIILLVPSTGPSWEIAMYRVGEVALGSICAFVVGWVISRFETRMERKDEAKEKGTA